jgi:hypothetical protein
VGEAGGGEPGFELGLGEAEPAVFEFLAEGFEGVGLEVDDQDCAARFQGAAGFGEDGGGIGGVDEDEGEEEDVDGGGIEGEVFGAAGAEVDVGEVEGADALAGGFEHGGGGVDGDDIFDVGGEQGEHGAGACADVGDGPFGVEEGEECFEVEAVAKPVGAEGIPFGGMFAEEGVGGGGGFASAEDGGEAVGVGFGEGVVFEVGAGEVAELFAGGIVGGGGEAVEHGGAFAASFGEVGVEEGFEVAGEGGLGELEGFGEFTDGEGGGGVWVWWDFGGLDLAFKEANNP